MRRGIIQIYRVFLLVQSCRATNEFALSMCMKLPSFGHRWSALIFWHYFVLLSCQRLSLTTLSYLWQRNQDELLDEMIESGLDAIIIKVAGIGLSVKHLGQSLVQMQPILRRLVCNQAIPMSLLLFRVQNEQYGAHICGEGGEYETLTLDCPLFKRRLKLFVFTIVHCCSWHTADPEERQQVETVIHSDNDFATVAYLRVLRATLENKPSVDLPVINPPELLSEEFVDLGEDISNPPPGDEADEILLRERERAAVFVTSSRVGPWVSVTNVQASQDPQIRETSIEEETVACFGILKSEAKS